MTSQDDLGMLWYGVSGVSFNPTDPSDVLLNTGTAAPLLSDHPRSIINPQMTATQITSQPTIAYGDPGTIPAQNQMLYDPNTGDFITQPEFMYETYESYEDDSSSNTVSQGQQNSTGYENSVTQTTEDESSNHTKTKKPKVHQHPSLKLKTPIAYQKDTDLNAIPIMREGIAVCEKCGAIGVRHAFYGKERKYCSLACARPPTLAGSYFVKGNSIETQKLRKETTEVDSSGIQFQHVDDQNTESAIETIVGIEQNDPLDTGIAEDAIKSEASPDGITALPPASTKSNSTCKDVANSFQWESSYFNDDKFVAAPVQLFKHAPMSECWEQISPGMKVEVSCREESVMQDSFWVATVLLLAGYKAKLRFEGFVEDSSKDFWVDLCSEDVHPVGWCATQGKALIPPNSIQYKYKDWKEFLMRRLTGARTLPTNFHTKVNESQYSRFSEGCNLEVVDKNRIAQMRVATVTEIVGKRLHLRYHGAPPDDNGFWCHEDSPIVHPVGWSSEVGHEIVASQSYHQKCLEVNYDSSDAAPDLFLSPMMYLSPKDQTFTPGMKLEAIDPLNLATICVATIMKVLGNNYLMIRIDSYDSDNTCSDWFCYHASSPYIFPAGFCEMNGINLAPPRGYDGQFSWFAYLQKTEAQAAPPQLFKSEVPNHGFEAGMSIEAVDLMDPRLVCVARVKDVKGRLLKIHFDGWENDFDQWVDCLSSDIYPVGWCKMVGYKLEGPRLQISAPIMTAPKRRTRGRGGRKGRGMGRRGAMSRGGIENALPPTLTNTQLAAVAPKRGRRARARGVSVRKSHLNPDQESSSDLNYGEGEVPKKTKGRRGRPRKVPLSASNHHPSRPTRTTRTLTSYAQSEDEGSEDTSSGVASLADSEASAEAWEGDSKGRQLNSESSLLNSGYRDSISFKTITDANFLTNEDPSLDCFFNNQDGSSHLRISSTYSAAESSFLDESQCSPTQFSNDDASSPPPSSPVEEHKFIPRIIDNANALRGGKEVQPQEWTPSDVASFLTNNDCAAYCDNFLNNKIDGTQMLKLSQNEVMEMTGMKVGPSLKIHDLIQQLLAIVNPAQARYQATLLKRGMTFGNS